MDMKAILLEPLNCLQKLTETALEEHGRLNIFSKSLQENTIGLKPAHAIRFAYCCDCFRTVTDVVFSDAILSEEEAEVSLPFVRAMAKLLKPIISSFEIFETATAQDCQQFFSLYKSETVPFGYANEQTRWAGAEIAEKIALVTGDAEVANIYKQMIDSVRQAFLIGSNQNGPDHLAPVATTENSAPEKESKILTKEFVLKLLENVENVNYEEFTSMEDAAAELISSSQFSLDLQGLISLSDSAAEALAKHKGLIKLDGLTTLTDSAAKALSTNACFLSLSLNGLMTLSDSAAKALAKHKYNLYLNGLTTLSDGVAKALAKHQEFLHLGGLSNLTDTAAKALAKHQGFLYLNGITSLSDSAAESLAKYKGWLDLHGLTTLSDSAAESLAKHEGVLNLHGLTTLSDSTAKSLASHQGYLHLDGLSNLTDTAAKALAKHQGYLHLNGLTSLSDSAAESLARLEGSLCLNGLTTLSDSAAESLAKIGGSLVLPGLTTLSDSAAESLAKHQGYLNLSGLTALSDSAAESLAKYKGELILFGLTEISDSVAESLAKHEGGLNLNRVESLSDFAAESLAKHQGELFLGRLTFLSYSVAEALAKHNGLLRLDGLTTLSDSVAESLAKHKGDLILYGLTTLSDSAAESFGKAQGKIFLDIFNTISDTAFDSLLYLRESLIEDNVFPSDFMEAIQSVIQSNTFNRLKNFNYDSEEFISATFEPEIEMNEQADSDNNEGFIEDVDSIEVDEVAVGYESDLNSCGNSLSIKFLTQQNAGSELSHVELTDPEGTIINSLGMKLVPIQPGEFLMGDPDDEEGENAAHRVRITKRFYIGMYAVTQAEYIAVTNENPSFYQGKKRPVEHVSWMEADSFCQQLSEHSIEKSVGRKYRLPSEAEWEYACRAGSTTDYAFGEDLEPSQANFSNSDSESTPQPTLPVGSLQPNAWGLYDMHGNVWEWCSDWFNNTYYEKSELNDPKGPKKGTHHTLRGGSASVADYECISFFRGEARMDMPLNEEEGGSDRFEVCGDFGFRVVCED